MTVKFTKKGIHLIVGIDGEIDHHTSEEIRNKIEKEYSRSGCKNLIFNFKKVNFMDSSGIGMVIGRYKYICERNGAVAVVEVNENIDRIFSISGLYKIIRGYQSLEEALENL